MITVPQIQADFVHRTLAGGVELAVDRLPERETVAIVFRMFAGMVNESTELAGIAAIAQQTLSKGTQNYSGRELADAFDALGAQRTSISGRQSMLVRCVCLPEFLPDVVDLVAEMLCRPTFPDEACRVAVELTQQDLKHVEDEPGEICRMMIQELTLGPTLGRDPMGTAESLERITPTLVREFWQSNYHRGRLQVAASGPIDADALAARIDERFAGLGSPEIAGRQNADFTFTPAKRHRDKDIKQQHIAITLPGAARDDADFPIEQVLLGVLSGGMSGRLFTEVREKLGLVYWVSAWHEQPRGAGVIHLRASSTPERCGQTYKTLLRELERLSEDLTDEEIDRAENSLISQMLTHNDITRSRAGGLSEDLFFEGRPIGLAPRLESISAVTRDQVEHYAHGFDLERICVATLGTQAL